MSVVLRGEGITRTFRTPAGDVHAVDGVSLEVSPGELVVLQGRSGAGKTTLLTVLGGLDRPTYGSVEVDGRAAQRPGELSVGQQQRVGLARAIVARPALLLADEPTGQLDSETGAAI